MATLNFEQLQSCLSSEDWQGAQKLLSDYFSGELTPEEKGEAYVSLVTLYTEAQNSLNSQESEILQNAIDQLKDMETQKRQLNDAIDIKSARNSIAQN